MGSCASHTDAGKIPGGRWSDSPDSSADAARLPLCVPISSPAHPRACLRLDGIESVRFDSFTYACDASGIIALIAGSRHRHSRQPSSFRHRSSPEAPFLDRHYPASSVVRASPPPRPARPAPRGGPVGACHATDGASRVASIPLLHACRRHYPGGTGRCPRRSLPGRWQPSPNSRRVGFRMSGFEACSAFTRVAARMLAKPPKAARFFGVLQTMSLPPSSAPTATGWSDSCRAGSAPAEEWRLGTAHVESGAGAPTLGSGGDSDTFAPGLNPAPIVTFPAPALRTRRADFRHRALQWDHAPRTRTPGRFREAGGRTLPTHLRTRHGFRSAFPSRLRRTPEPVYASMASNPYGSTPSLMHVMLPESSPSSRGPGIATPASLLPSVIAPHLRPLSSTGITRRHQSYGPLRHPDRPGLPLAGVRLARATPPTGLPVLRPSPSCMRAAAITPAEPAGALVARFPADGSLPRIVGGSASA